MEAAVSSKCSAAAASRARCTCSRVWRCGRGVAEMRAETEAVTQPHLLRGEGGGGLAVGEVLREQACPQQDA